MTSELVYRMRTCAAAIVAAEPRESWVALVSDDAARLLVEASKKLYAPVAIKAKKIPEPILARA